MSDILQDKSIFKENPLVTFVLFTYNQENYIAEAVAAALAQEYSPLEIIISDDCSTDATFEIAKKIVNSYSGSNSIILNRNEVNLGLISHVNKLNKIAKGELIVVAAGDDVSLVERTSVIVDVWLRNGKKPCSIHSPVICINADGKENELRVPPIALKKMTEKQLCASCSLVIGASHAWTKSVVNEFGPIVYVDAYEDLVIAFRSYLIGDIIYIDKVLVKYRTFTGITAKLAESRKSLAKSWRATSASIFQRMIDCEKINKPDLALECRNAAIKWKIRAAVFEGRFLSSFSDAIDHKMVFVFLKAVFNLIRFSAKKV